MNELRAISSQQSSLWTHFWSRAQHVPFRIWISQDQRTVEWLDFVLEVNDCSLQLRRGQPCMWPRVTVERQHSSCISSNSSNSCWAACSFDEVCLDVCIAEQSNTSNSYAIRASYVVCGGQKAVEASRIPEICMDYILKLDYIKNTCEWNKSLSLLNNLTN